MNFKCKINVKAMTPREYQKSCALDLLVSKGFQLAGQSKILGTIQLIVFKRVFLSCKQSGQ